MRFLFVDDEALLRELMVDMLKSLCPECQVLTAADGQSAIETIKKNPDLDCVFCDYNMPGLNGGSVFTYMRSAGLGIPFVLVSSDSPDQHPEFAHEEIHYLQKPDIIEPLASILDKLKVKMQKYHPVKLDYLYSVRTLAWDVFLKLSEEKFLLVVHKNSEFSKENLKHFQEKGVSHLYLQARDFTPFVKALVLNMNELLQTAGHLSSVDHVMVNETLRASLKVFGVTPEVEKLTRDVVASTVHAIQNTSGLKALFRDLNIDEDSYVSSHSVALSYLVCHMLSKLPWASELAYKKLAFAATLHDITVETAELAKANTLSEISLLNKKYSDEQISEYKNHPLMGAEIAKLYSGSAIPPDVDNIILQHHERPDGSGFPGAIASLRIPPLSAAFILAHDLLNHLINHDYEINLKKFFDDHAQLYSTGSFRQIAEGLKLL